MKLKASVQQRQPMEWKKNSLPASYTSDRVNILEYTESCTKKKIPSPKGKEMDN